MRFIAVIVLGRTVSHKTGMDEESGRDLRNILGLSLRGAHNADFAYRRKDRSYVRLRRRGVASGRIRPVFAARFTLFRAEK